MVAAPVVAESWHTLRMVRQKMLAESFSFLPIEVGNEWKVVSDFSIARVLRGAANGKDRDSMLALSIGDAINNGIVVPLDPTVVERTASARKVLAGQRDARPILVTDGKSHPIGIVTPFDLR